MMIKKLLFIILFLLLPSVCYGALSEGTNCGFVSSAPEDDPDKDYGQKDIDTRAVAASFTSPADATTITEMGWWCGNATEAANFQCGIYADDSGNNLPEELLETSGDIAKGTDTGWKKVTGLDWSITGSTVYWLGIQLDDTTTTTTIDGDTRVSYERELKYSQTSLPNPWGASDNSSDTNILAIYAVYTTGGGAERRVMLIQ